MAKLKVLIVDDDEVVCAQLAALLTAQKHVVHQLPSAIGVTRAVVQHEIDVVVIDIMMPSLSGDKLALILRENPRFKRLGVVLVSSRRVEELEALASKVQADGVVSKGDMRANLVPAVEAAARARGAG